MLLTAAFTAYAFVPSALAAHLLAIFGRTGIDPATVVLIGALFGPAQVAARVTELAFGRDIHPLTIGRAAILLLVAAFALLALFGISPLLAAAFSIMFGAANGLITITRGALPLALFGAEGYGRMMGRISGFWLGMQAAAPLVMAFVAERASDATALGLAAAFTVVALVCFATIRRPAAVTLISALRADKDLVDLALRGVAAVAGELRAVEEAPLVALWPPSAVTGLKCSTRCQISSMRSMCSSMKRSVVTALDTRWPVRSWKLQTSKICTTRSWMSCTRPRSWFFSAAASACAD